MLHEALTSFEAELDKLIRFLQASDAEDALIANVLSRPATKRAALHTILESIQSNSTIKRRQSYVSSIIVLYGALERYIEEVVAEFTYHLVEIHQGFEKLPGSIRERHTKLSIDYLASLKDGKVRQTEDISSVVATLNDCLTGKAPFRLNARAFSLRSSNMKLGRVREIMGNLDVQLGGKRILAAPSYAQFLSEVFGFSVHDMQDGEIESTLDHVDQLVSLRNDIAHGVSNIGSIEDNDIVRERAAKLHAFVMAVNDILTCELIGCKIVMQQLISISGEVHVFGENIACFLWPLGRLVTGDTIVMQPAEGGADLRHGPVESIEVDRVAKTEVLGREGLMVGVKVPFKVKPNGAFYVWRSSG